VAEEHLAKVERVSEGERCLDIKNSWLVSQEVAVVERMGKGRLRLPNFGGVLVVIHILLLRRITQS
jgi:hypothetical protein